MFCCGYHNYFNALPYFKSAKISCVVCIIFVVSNFLCGSFLKEKTRWAQHGTLHNNATTRRGLGENYSKTTLILYLICLIAYICLVYFLLHLSFAKL